MSRWWRAYDDAVDNPKLCLLSDRAHRAWFNLMCLTSAYDGVLPDIKIVALKLRMAPKKAKAVIDELRGAGLFEDTGDGIGPHNWNSRQFKTDDTDPTNAERQQRFRDNKRNAKTVTHPVTTSGTQGVTVTHHREHKTDSESKKERKSTASAVSEDRSPAPSNDVDLSAEDQFWALAGTASKAGIARSRLGQLAQLCHGDFESAVATLNNILAAKIPSPFFAAVIASLKSEQAPLEEGAPRNDGSPDFVQAARREGMYVTKLPGGRWRIAGQTYSASGEEQGW